jgi:uncharacterized iron-regulated protein
MNEPGALHAPTLHASASAGHTPRPMRPCDSRLLLVVLVGLSAACATSGRVAARRASDAGTRVDSGEHAFFTADGATTNFAAVLAGVADVDLVAFGELHDHAVGSRQELALLTGMAAQPRPVALAMEFFEADHQAALDQYLAGAIDEPTFRTRTDRDARYDASHRPLIELCKQRRIPVIAANAPRRLVTGYRKSGAPSYEAYLSSLSAADRGYMPRSSVPPDDEFKVRFMKFMGPIRGPAYYRSMALWNDAMAESIADFRVAHPEHRVLLVVGGFHVAGRLGAVTQYLARRPGDRVSVLLMQPTEGPMRLPAEEYGEGDVVLKVRLAERPATAPRS